MEGNDKWLLRELTAIKVKLDNVSQDVNDLKDKFDSTLKQVVKMEVTLNQFKIIQKKVEELENTVSELKPLKNIEERIDNIEKRIEKHSSKLDELANVIKSLQNTITFRGKMFWHTVTIILASVVSVIVAKLIR